VKPAVVRFYFDADILGSGRLIAGLRADCTYPGDSGAVIHRRERPLCLVASTDVPDQDWIPLVADAGYFPVPACVVFARKVTPDDAQSMRCEAEIWRGPTGGPFDRSIASLTDTGDAGFASPLRRPDRFRPAERADPSAGMHRRSDRGFKRCRRPSENSAIGRRAGRLVERLLERGRA